MTLTADLTTITHYNRNMSLLRITNFPNTLSPKADVFVLTSEWYLATAFVNDGFVELKTIFQIKAQELGELLRVQRFNALIDEIIIQALNMGVDSVVLWDSVIAEIDPYPSVLGAYRSVLQENGFVRTPDVAIWVYRLGETQE